MEAEELIEKLNKIADKIEKRTKDVIIEMPSEVKAWGFSAHIPFKKKYIGHPVDVIVRKKPK